MSTTGARRAIPGLVLILLVAWMVRLQYLAFLPSFAYSWDMACWDEIAGFIGSGTNPYETTASLSWPPLWMLCLFILDKVAEVGRFEFLDVLRGFLLVIETVGIALAWRLARTVWPDRNVTRALLFGLALNPVALLLTCPHGNFDSMVAMWVVAPLIALVGYQRTRDPMDWLLACFFLGLGVLTKTVPFALAPLLVPGAREMTAKSRLLGVSLFAGPSVLGLGVLFALSPGTIIDRVFLYSPVPGRFGFTGIASLLDATALIPSIGRISSLLILALVAWGSVRAWSWRVGHESQFVLLAGLILLAIPTLGPGFGPQYAFWFLAPLAVAFVGASRRLRIPMIAAFAVTAVTYAILYGFARDLGQPVPYYWWSPTAVEFGRTITRDVPRAWLTLPMWISWVIVLVFGALELREPGARAGAQG